MGNLVKRGDLNHKKPEYRAVYPVCVLLNSKHAPINNIHVVTRSNPFCL